jgi:hypothetical protein
MITKTRRLASILKEAEFSDLLEEDALDYLSDRRIVPTSHSRTNILCQAFKAGWRPN